MFISTFVQMIIYSRVWCFCTSSICTFCQLEVVGWAEITGGSPHWCNWLDSSKTVQKYIFVLLTACRHSMLWCTFLMTCRWQNGKIANGKMDKLAILIITHFALVLVWTQNTQQTKSSNQWNKNENFVLCVWYKELFVFNKLHNRSNL